MENTTLSSGIQLETTRFATHCISVYNRENDGVLNHQKTSQRELLNSLTCSSGSPVAEEAMLETARLLRLSGNFNPGI